MAPKKEPKLKLREALSIMQVLGAVKGQQRVYDERSGGYLQDAWFPDDRPNAGAMTLKDANKRLRVPEKRNEAPDNMRLLPQNEQQNYNGIYQDTPGGPKSKLGKELLYALPWVNRNMPGLPYGDYTNGRTKEQQPVQIPSQMGRPKSGESFEKYLRRLQIQSAI